MPTFKQLMKVAQATVNDKTSGKRIKEIAAIMKKNEVLKGMTPEKAVRILEDLGPTYVKVGQIASNRADILPIEYCNALAQLRSDVEPMDFATVEGVLNESYGKSWHEVFSTIEKKPLGAASIAQVHRAVLHDGTVVAVKIRRPGIVEEMTEDITLMRHLLALAELGTTKHAELLNMLDGMVDELERTTENETDFRIELQNLVQFREVIKGEVSVASPQPYPEYTTDAVLVMEYVTGIPLSHYDDLKKGGYDCDEVAQVIVQSYVVQVVDKGFFHADPHEGNIFVRDGKVVWIDLGMVGTLNSVERSLVNRAMFALAMKDAYALKETLLALTKAHGSIDHGKLLKQIDDLVTRVSGVDLSDMKLGDILSDIITILQSQNLSILPSFTMLARGLITVEGVIADLSPTTNLTQIVTQHVEKQLFRFDDVEKNLKSIGIQSAQSFNAATQIPQQLSHSLDMLNQGQLSVETQFKVQKHSETLINNVVGYLSLALISTGLFIGSSIICATNMQPRFLEVPFLGVIGYLSAFVLGVYIVYATFKMKRKEKHKQDDD